MVRSEVHRDTDLLKARDAEVRQLRAIQVSACMQSVSKLELV